MTYINTHTHYQGTLRKKGKKRFEELEVSKDTKTK